jgi:PAS domain S-box-containing protein
MAPRRAEVLVGWKEIAAYLGCSVATAARRERDGLPVFRSGGQVRAFPGDIDKWLKGLRAGDIGSIIKAESVEKVDEADDVSAVLATLLRGDSRERLAVIRLGKDVAEFEHIEVQLKSAEEKYRELVEAIPEWAWEMNADGEYVYSSPQVEDILGYEPDDLIGYRVDEFLIHQDDAVKCRAVMEELAEQKEVVRDFLCRFIHRTGSVRYIETSANPLFDESGMLVGIKGVSRDVTERVRLQVEIGETRRYLENVLHGSMDAIVTTDMDGHVKIWNRGAEAIYGYTEAEALGQSIDKLTDPPGWSRKFGDLFRIIEVKGGWYSEEPVERKRKDGNTFYASASYSIVQGPDGESIGVCGITRDITGRLNAERFTREALSRFESVLENVPNVAVLGFSSDGRVQHWNRAAERIFGHPADYMVGRAVRESIFFDGDNKSAFKKELERVFNTGEPNEPREISFVNPRGEKRWVYSQMFPVLVDDRVEEVFQMSMDVTDRKKAEDALLNAAEEWRRTFDTVPDSIAIIDGEYRILRLNKAMADRIGVHPRDAIGLTCYKAFHGLEEPHKLCPHSLLLKDGREHTADIFDDRMDEYFGVSVSPIRDASGELIGSVHVARDVTKRRLAEELLGKSEREKSAILGNLSEFVVYMNKDLEVVWVNKAVSDSVGTEPGDLIGRRCYEILFGYDDVCEDCHAAGVFETGERVERERELPDGHIWNMRCEPVRDESGEIVGVVELSTDITGRRRAEEARKESEEMFRNVVESSPMGMHFYKLTPDDRLVFTGANRAADEILGLDNQQFVGKTVEEAFPSSAGTELPDRYKLAASTGEPWRSEHVDYEDKRIKGAFEVYAFRTSPRKMAALFSDITERKKAEKALRESEERYGKITSNLPKGAVHIMDKDFRYVFNDGDVLKEIGLPNEELVGKSIYDVLPPETAQMVAGYYKRALEGEPVSFESDFAGRTFLINAVPLEGPDGERDEILVLSTDISELERAEDTVRKLSRAVEQSPSTIVITNAAGEIEYVNPKFTEITGYAFDEVAGRNPRVLKSGKQTEEFYEELWDSITSGSEWRGEFCNKKKNDEFYWESASISPVKNEEGVTTHYIKVAEDITVRKQVEESLRESEEKFRELAEESPNMIFINKKGRVVYANKKSAEIMGYGREKFYSPDFDFRTLIAPESVDLMKRNFAKHSKGQDVEPYEYSLITKGGTAVDVIITTKLITYGGETAILGIITDITERKRVEGALQESEEKYRSLFEESPTAITLVDKSGVVIDCNRNTEELIGYSKEEIIGKPFEELTTLDGRDLPKLRETYEELSKGKAIKPYELEIIRKNGERRWIDVVNSLLMKDSEVVGFQIISTDVTERKWTEDLTRAQHELSEALTVATSLDEALALCTEAAIKGGGMDSGGVYLVDEKSGDMDLVYSKGLSSGFIKSASHYDGDTSSARLIKAGKPVYSVHQELGIPLDETRRNEGLRAIAIVPIFYEGKIIACMNVASHVTDEIPISARKALETIAARIGSVIAHVRAGEALRESEEKYRNLVETVKEGIGIADPAENLTFVNKAFAETLGYTVDELTGTNLRELTTRKGYKKIEEEAKKRRSGGSSRYVVELKHKDGRRLDFLVSATPIYAEGGSYAGAVAAVTRLPELNALI